ncbi:WRP73 protein, partial [Atractosteus spatula]|nr:WRP73 protein [Atractosteus spatula]
MLGLVLLPVFKRVIDMQRATCVQYRLVVRDLNTLQILHLYTCLDQIQHVEWSSDSLFILCALYKRGLVQASHVWSLEQPDWHCKIDEGSAGLVSSRWSPDGRHILNTTEFHVSVNALHLPCTSAFLLENGSRLNLGRTSCPEECFLKQTTNTYSNKFGYQCAGSYINGTGGCKLENDWKAGLTLELFKKDFFMRKNLTRSCGGAASHVCFLCLPPPPPLTQVQYSISFDHWDTPAQFIPSQLARPAERDRTAEMITQEGRADLSLNGPMGMGLALGLGGGNTLLLFTGLASPCARAVLSRRAQSTRQKRVPKQDFQVILVTVWSLCTKSVSYIKYPKACQQGIDFTKDGRYMALAERRDCKDYVSVFVCRDWQLLRHFETETQDLAGLEWAPNGCVLAVLDSCLEYKVLLYSLDGRLLSTYSAYEWSLGIKSVVWSHSSQFLAIGSYDEKVRILNHITWKKITEFEHPAAISNSKVVVYKEVEKHTVVGNEDLSFHHTLSMGNSLFSTQSKYEICPLPVQIPVVKPDPDRANPKIGIACMAFSSDNRYLATKNDSMPNNVWIWDMQKLRLFVVLQQVAAVRGFQWDPRRPRLAVCTGSSKVFLWSPAGCVSVQVPVEGNFQVLALSWHSSGNSLVLLSKEHLCLCYMEEQEES